MRHEARLELAYEAAHGASAIDVAHEARLELAYEAAHGAAALGVAHGAVALEKPLKRCIKRCCYA